MALLEVKNVKKIYTTRFGGSQVEALRNVSFSVEPGEYVAIMGESGSGKTTLLNILAALDQPTAGRVYLKGNDIGKVKEKEMAAFRRQNLGFVFQDFNLLDTFSLRDNIFLPLAMAVCHVAAAFPVVRKVLVMLNFTATKLFIACTAATVLVFAIFYVIVFAVTAREYYKIVNE